MKFILPVMLIGASAAHAGDAHNSGAPHYLLLYPSASVETDAEGKCTRLTNLSNELVYVPLTEPIAQVAKTRPDILEIKGCAQR